MSKRIIRSKDGAFYAGLRDQKEIIWSRKQAEGWTFADELEAKVEVCWLMQHCELGDNVRIE